MEELQLYVSKEYLNVFNHLIVDHETDSFKLNLFSLRLSNKNFNYDLLIDELVNKLVTFCTCSKKYKEYIELNKVGTLSRTSRGLFRKYIDVKRNNIDGKTLSKTTDGEVGELMLYSFAESHLDAPKILTKMRFKTSTNDPVKRADGIHLLKLSDDYYEIVYGESKLYENLSRGLTDAFSSISDFVNRDNNNINHEQAFLIENMDSEFNEEEYNKIKEILIPNEKPIVIDNSFIIFVGFEINIPDEMKLLKGLNFQKSLHNFIKCEVEKRIEHIKKKINEFELQNYNFYIYLVPFTNLNETKLEILQQILS